MISTPLLDSQTNAEYLPAPTLTGKRLAKERNGPDNLKGSEVILFYEQRPSSNNKRWILYAHQDKDGALFFTTTKGVISDYVKQIDEKDWENLKSRLECRTVTALAV